ncbi:uncharacterized protein LOC114946214 [Nylanderia fulva]|uniref:uncharacterized protein LOC114946214 n=1 Tax=Nylanderia fulva TaxID=613905 RepID=UPI0010FB9FCB|nr:uncharacterized protein LOC114946214 [Nylanderia fulva]
MPDLKKQYKKPPSTFGNVKKIKSDLAHKQQERRKKRRTNDFERNREKKQSSNFSSTNSQKHEIKRNLVEWRAEREKRKEKELKKKPPFIVGIVRHKYFSPVTIKSSKNPVITKTEGQKKKEAKKPPAINDNLTKDIPVPQTNEFPTKEAMKNNIEMPTEKNQEHSVEYFKDLLYNERERLKKNCEHWSKMSRDVKEDMQCNINQAVGQTTLLISKKFSQFYGLILICEKGDADIPVTCADLHGFWDMMYLEVKDCDSRFAKLEELQANHWREESSFPEFVTPYTSDKKSLEKAKRSINNSTQHCKCRKDLSKIYTSTPYPEESKTELNSYNMNTSLLTMKISQLYNKSTILIDKDDTISCKSEQTPRKHSSLGKFEKLEGIFRLKSISDADNNSQDLLKKIDGSELEEMKIHKLSCVEKRLEMDYSLDSSASTVIERTIADKNNTLKETSNGTFYLIELLFLNLKTKDLLKNPSNCLKIKSF